MKLFILENYFHKAEVIFFRITGQGIFLKITITIISGPPTRILKKKERKTLL